MIDSSTTNAAIPSVLQRIVATKVEEVAAASSELSLADLKAQVAADKRPRRGFAEALRTANIGIIAEIKKLRLLKGLLIIILPQPILLSSTNKLGLAAYQY